MYGYTRPQRARNSRGNPCASIRYSFQYGETNESLARHVTMHSLFESRLSFRLSPRRVLAKICALGIKVCGRHHNLSLA